MTSPDVGVLLLDDRRVFVAANERAAEILGTTVDELVGRRADEYMPLIARPLYPLAWQGFVMRGKAHGSYAAKLGDDTLQPLEYVGFANRPIRSLHFFVIQAADGRVDAETLVPRQQADRLQVGVDLSDDVHDRLIAEADREEWRLPVTKGAERAVFAGLFDSPVPALEVLESIRRTGAIEASLAKAAGATPAADLTLVAGRAPYTTIGIVLEAIRAAGGQIMANIDERRTR